MPTKTNSQENVKQGGAQAPVPPQVPQNKNSNLRPEQLQAASILIQAAKAAFNKGGVYSMDDVVYIKQAIDVFTIPQQ